MPVVAPSVKMAIELPPTTAVAGAGASAGVTTPNSDAKVIRASASQDRLLAITVSGPGAVAGAGGNSSAAGLASTVSPRPLTPVSSPLPSASLAPPGALTLAGAATTPRGVAAVAAGVGVSQVADLATSNTAEALVTNFSLSPVDKLAGCSVLVVDDFNLCCEAARVMCGLWGMRVYATQDPVQALKWVRDKKAPDPVTGVMTDFTPAIALVDSCLDPRSRLEREKERDLQQAQAAPAAVKAGAGAGAGASSAAAGAGPPAMLTGVAVGQALHAVLPDLALVLMQSNHDDPDVKEPAGMFQVTLQKPVRHSLLLDTVRGVLTKTVVRVVKAAPRNTLSTNFAAAHPLRILVAEDNPVNQKLIKKVLEKMGYEKEVTIVVNGLLAVEAVKTRAFDVIFMDMQMPEMDGITATKAIRQLHTEDLSGAGPAQYRYDLHRPTIIAMTANAMETDKERCFAAGMDDYLSKPIMFDQVQEKLAKYSTGSAQPAGAAAGGKPPDGKDNAGAGPAGGTGH